MKDPTNRWPKLLALLAALAMIAAACGGGDDVDDEVRGAHFMEMNSIDVNLMNVSFCDGNEFENGFGMVADPLWVVGTIDHRFNIG